MDLGRHELGLDEAAIGREWLVTNGLGGFASSTVGMLNTRRYHGWLVAQVARFGGRFVVLSKLEEEVRLDGEPHPLSADCWQAQNEDGWRGERPAGAGPVTPGAVITPRGYRHLESFSLSPLPVFTYCLGGVFIERTLFMPRGENRVVALYHFSSPRPVRLILRLRPLVTFRFYHHLLRANEWPFQTKSGPGWVSVQPHPDSPYLVLRHDPGRWTPEGQWWFGAYYLEEERRGLDHTEDLFSPGYLDFPDLGDGDRVAVTAVLAEDAAEAGRLRDADFRVGVALAWQDREEARLESVVRQARGTLERTARSGGRPGLPGPGERPDPCPLFPYPSAFFADLVRAADAFVAVRSGHVGDRAGAVAGGPPRRTTVIAGYPWFEDWGRDTLIAVPGLFLVTGRWDEALRVLLDYAAFARDGLVPNSFPDQAAEPDYHAADAALWLFWAVQAYLAYTGDRRTVEERLLPVLRGIAASYHRGTGLGIRSGPDGLIHAGESGVAVTWMDAKLGDWVVTPREGYPVEINALWYNALRFLADIEGDEAGPGSGNGPGATGAGRIPHATGAGPAARQTWSGLAARVKAAFNARFWNKEKGCLYDVVHDPSSGRLPDASVRPNQLLAVSLPHAVLDEARWRPVVEVCLRELYTPFGLRSLSPADPGYRGLYRGGPAERDRAYHQGTVWPWLLGPFLTALRRVHGYSEESRLIAARMVRPFEGHLREAGLGYISEVFDGDFPFSPGGCIAQAWSVAEVLRAYAEEVLGARPRAGPSPGRPPVAATTPPGAGRPE